MEIAHTRVTESSSDLCRQRLVAARLSIEYTHGIHVALHLPEAKVRKR
jgi:hypothetical protein